MVPAFLLGEFFGVVISLYLIYRLIIWLIKKTTKKDIFKDSNFADFISFILFLIILTVFAVGLSTYFGLIPYIVVAIIFIIWIYNKFSKKSFGDKLKEIFEEEK